MIEWAIEMVAHLAGELVLAATRAASAESDWVNAEPRPGELVVEMSMHGWPSGTHGLDHKTRFGRYLGRETASCVDEDGESYTESSELVVLYDGRVFRWTNCRLARVPEDASLRSMVPWIGDIGRMATRNGFVSPKEWARRIGGDAEPVTRCGRELWRFVETGK